MRKIVIMSLAVLLLFGFTGCGAKEDARFKENAKDIVFNAVSKLSEANSIEYSYTEATELMFSDATRSLSFSESEIKMLRTPFTIFSRIMTENESDGEQGKFYREMYSTVDNGILSIFVRPSFDSSNTELGEWHLTMEADEKLTTSFITSNIMTFQAAQFIIESNIDSFTYVETENAGKDALVKFKGAIDPQTVLDAYRIYLRESFLEVPTTPTPLRNIDDPTDEQIKDEIRSGEHYELLHGIPSLAFSDGPTPIFIWIEKESMTIKIIEVDRREEVQAISDTIAAQESYLQEATCEKAFAIFEIFGTDTFTTMVRPE